MRRITDSTFLLLLVSCFVLSPLVGCGGTADNSVINIPGDAGADEEMDEDYGSDDYGQSEDDNAE